MKEIERPKQQFDEKAGADRDQGKIVQDYSFEVFWRDELTASVSVEGSVVKNQIQRTQ